MQVSSDAKERLLRETLELSAENARLALDLANGDLDKAIEMASYVDPIIMVIHASFILGSKNREYGIFSLLANGREGKVFSVLPVINYREELAVISLEGSPEAFIRDIKEMRDKGEDRSGSRLLTFFYQTLSSSEINSLYSLIKKGEDEALHNNLKQSLKSFFGRHVELKTKTLLLTPLQCETRNIQLDDEYSKDEEEEEEDLFVVMLEVSPMISPNKGKPINFFKIGEKIPVVIIDRTDVGRYMASLLMKQGEFVLAEILEIHFHDDTDRYQVIVSFGPKIHGRFMVEHQIRLAMEEVVKEEEEEVIDEKVQTKGVDWFLVIILSLGIICMVILAFIFFF